MPTKRYENLDKNTKLQIHQAASPEFIAHGYEKASLNRIIDAADLSKGSFYYYFEDKMDLFLTTVGNALDEATSITFPMIDREYGDDFWGELEEVIQQMWLATMERPDLMALVQKGMQTAQLQDGNKQLAAIYERGKSITRKFLQQGQGKGAVRHDLPLELIVHVVYHAGEALDYWFLGHLTDSDEFDIHEATRIYIDVFRRIATPIVV